MLAQSSFTREAWANLLAEADDRAELPSWAEHQAQVAAVDLPVLVLDVDDVADMLDFYAHHSLPFNSDSRAAYIGLRLIALSTDAQGNA